MLADPPRERILIGEPDPLARIRLEQILANCGYAVESFADGSRALERLLAPDAPGIALLDFNLPGKNCLEICQALRTSCPSPVSHRNCSPWIIAMSRAMSKQQIKDPTLEHPGFAPISANDLGWILQAGVCDILTKPVDAGDLALRMHAAQHVHALREELVRAVETFGFGASHDPLTGLWNREAFLSLLYQETGRSQRTGSPWRSSP